LKGDQLKRNIELKARCGNLAAAREAARALGAEFAGILEQRDTYFVAVNGRLKLRETTGWPAELIAYSRTDAAAVRGSDYRLIPVPDPAALRAGLAAALGVRSEVVKRRELWLWRGVRIHLDEVQELGTFVELEAVMAASEPDEDGHRKVAALREALGIAEADLIACSYADLLRERCPERGTLQSMTKG
jgi:adenylate cyclase class IV